MGSVNRKISSSVDQATETATFQRARQPQQKEDRRQAILEVAQQELTSSSFSELTMAKLAEKAGLAKGTLYLYFETKEELLLALVENLLQRWFNEIPQKLHKAKGTPDVVARAIGASLLKQDALAHLLPIVLGVTEQNADQRWIAEYRTRVLDQCRVLGKSIESLAQGMKPGSGTRFLLYALALMTGLGQLRGEQVKNGKLSARPHDLKAQRSSFEREFAAGLQVVMRGLRTV
jgi:AcrR family transcriptional regulator